MMATETLTLSQKIEIALIKSNMVQADVVAKLKKVGIPMNTSKFSVKKKYTDFSDVELKAMSKILKTNLLIV